MGRKISSHYYSMADLRIVSYDDRSQKHPGKSQLPEWIPKHEFLMLIVAPAGSGKTTLLLNILLRVYKQYWNNMYLFSPTIHNDDKWRFVLDEKRLLAPSKMIHNKENVKTSRKSNQKNIQDLEDLEEKHGPDGLTRQEKYYKKISSGRLTVNPIEVGSRRSRYETSDLITFSREKKNKGKGKKKGYVPAEESTDESDIEEILERLAKRQRLANDIVPAPTPQKRKEIQQFKDKVLKIPAWLRRGPHKSEGELNLKNKAKRVLESDSDSEDIQDSDVSSGDVGMYDINKMAKDVAIRHIKANTRSSKRRNKNPSGRLREKTSTKRNQNIDPDNVFEEYDEKTLTKEMKKIDDMVESIQDSSRRKHRGDKLQDSMDRTLWVFDDMVGSGLFNQKRNNAFKRLTVRRRHFYSSLIGVTQAYKEIPKTTRTNANVLILFKIDSDEELKTIYQEYPMGLKFKEWLQVYHYCTSEPYNFIMFNLQTTNPNYRIVKNFDTPISETFIQNLSNPAERKTPKAPIVKEEQRVETLTHRIPLHQFDYFLPYQ